jgi:hypothetical protein
MTITKTCLSEWLGTIQNLHWLSDKESGGFYGSCIVELPTSDASDAVLAKDIPKFGKKKPKVCLYELREGVTWPPPDCKDTEFPPVGR